MSIVLITHQNTFGDQSARRLGGEWTPDQIHDGKTVYWKTVAGYSMPDGFIEDTLFAWAVNGQPAKAYVTDVIRRKALKPLCDSGALLTLKGHNPLVTASPVKQDLYDKLRNQNPAEIPVLPRRVAMRSKRADGRLLSLDQIDSLQAVKAAVLASCNEVDIQAAKDKAAIVNEGRRKMAEIEARATDLELAETELIKVHTERKIAIQQEFLDARRQAQVKAGTYASHHQSTKGAMRKADEKFRAELSAADLVRQKAVGDELSEYRAARFALADKYGEQRPVLYE